MPGRQETTCDYDILVEIPWGKSRADRKVEQKGLARAPMMTTLLLMLIGVTTTRMRAENDDDNDDDGAGGDDDDDDDHDNQHLKAQPVPLE